MSFVNINVINCSLKVVFRYFYAMEMMTISLKKGKESNIARKHPWIFSGALYKVNDKIEEGEAVRILDYQGKTLGVGHYANASIAIRILSFEDVNIDQDFYFKKIQNAKSLRQDILKLPSSTTNCYRLIAGESDQLPGLIIDIYNNNAVIQCHSAGMLKDIVLITDALKGVFENKLDTIYLKSIHVKEQKYDNKHLIGSKNEDIVLENGHNFHINWAEGQKTGFFLDQRENRQMLGSFVKGKKVLNTFCYTGGFSVYAMQAGATQVDSIDISSVAMEQTTKNIQLNSEKTEIHQSITGNVMEYLKDIEQDYYDVIILDPPAFAKNRNKSHNAVQAYKRLNLAAMEKIAPKGIIFTFSCSQVVDRELFENTIRAAAIESGRNIRILKHLNQSPDHCMDIFHQEGHYLKGLVLYIE